MDCSIVIPVWAFDERIHRVWEVSYRAYRDYSDGAKMIIIDNGSSPALPVSTVRHESNQGYIPALNEGLALADTEWIVVASCDVIVPPGFLAPLLGEGVRSAIDRVRGDKGGFLGSLYGMHRSVYDAIGGYDPSWINYGDRDFAIRAQMAGFPVVLADPPVLVEHREPSRGTVEKVPRKTRVAEVKKFKAKWGVTSYAEWESKNVR